MANGNKGNGRKFSEIQKEDCGKKGAKRQKNEDKIHYELDDEEKKFQDQVTEMNRMFREVKESEEAEQARKQEKNSAWEKSLVPLRKL